MVRLCRDEVRQQGAAVMGALISEHELVAFLGIECPAYEFATRHKLPVVLCAGKLHVEVSHLPAWRAALASEARASGVPATTK